jgi:hypothetical protein
MLVAYATAHCTPQQPHTLVSTPHNESRSKHPHSPCVLLCPCSTTELAGAAATGAANVTWAEAQLYSNPGG